MMKIFVGLFMVFSLQASAQEAPTPALTFDSNAKYSLYTRGPTRTIFLKIEKAGEAPKIVSLGRQAFLQTTAAQTSVFVHRTKTNTYLFDTVPTRGKVSYSDLSLVWKDVQGNLGCSGGFSDSSFFITSLEDETIYLQAYCPHAKELYIRSFEGNDWSNRFPKNDTHVETLRAVSTDVNFYTFYVRSEDQLLYSVDAEDRQEAIEMPEAQAITDIKSAERSISAKNKTYITLTVVLKDGSLQKAKFVENVETRELKPMLQKDGKLWHSAE